MQMNSSAAADAISQLRRAAGDGQVLTGERGTRRYRKGFREGEGQALAVVLPTSLMSIWNCIEVCCRLDLIVLMQAANTGLTGGSVPDGDAYDRPVVIINTTLVTRIDLIGDGRQVVCLAGARLYELEEKLAPIGRQPHSVIGSSCIGASVIGGVANSSGGALVQRGPAYTELSLYARRTADGSLELVNELGIDLGRTPQEILSNLDGRRYSEGSVCWPDAPASDGGYAARLRDVDAESPARFNANPVNLRGASGSAGKVAIFAVRLDTFPANKTERVFYVGANSPEVLTALRRDFLSFHQHLPVAAEYMHRRCFDAARRYGKDTYVVIDRFGTKRMPQFFGCKGRFDGWMSAIPRAGALSDHLLQLASGLLPEFLPSRILDFRDLYEHHLILRMADDGIAEAEAYLTRNFGQNAASGWFACDAAESKSAFLLRFAAAGAAIRQAIVAGGNADRLVALDIALPRNEAQWLEVLSPDLAERCDDTLYYGHFFCHVFHQDYILKQGVDPHRFKKDMLHFLDARRAEYPAEHNVGHMYEAKPALAAFYRALDPGNGFNAGIGKMSKHRGYGCNC